ncbi:hypothetical protein [Acinetobacter pittii]|nr:hypothetical protein [Acinetobacter pittii]
MDTEQLALTLASEFTFPDLFQFLAVCLVGFLLKILIETILEFA